MINKYEINIIDKLLGKYENSKSFIGENKVNQKFAIKVSDLFHQYEDHSNFEVFHAVNEAIDILARRQLVIAKSNSANVYKEVILNLEQLDKAYECIGRTPKKDIQSSLLQLLNNYKVKNEVLEKYCEAQIERISLNKSIQFFSGDLEELEKIMIAVYELFKVESETYIRDFSIKVFRDSKTFDGFSAKTANLIYEYGNFPEKEQVLGDLNIIKNPTYANFKGQGIITLKGQRIDLGILSSDIAISSVMLSDIDSIHVAGNAVITIENLTSFHAFKNKDMLVIYLGGYHNGIRREFIKRVYKQNPGVQFYHFGDIDAGGFYILEHLKRQTGVNFEPYKMDIDTLKTYHKYTKKLTENDRDRLIRLKDSQYSNVIEYMLKNNCKLEQEAIDIGIGG